MQDDFDLLIVGGGLVGASLAASVTPQLRVGLVESQARAPHDARTLALTWSTRQVFTGLDIWREVAAAATPITQVHVSREARAGAVHLSHRHSRTPALGYVLPAAKVHAALHAKLETRENFTRICPAHARAQHIRDDSICLALDIEGKAQTLRAKLLAVADGGGGLFAGAEEKIYAQSAVVCSVTASELHHGRAFERFTPHGPLALLPQNTRDYAVIWSTDNAQVESRMAQNDAEFLSDLQVAFGDRAGNFTAARARACYALTRRHVATPAASRMLALGNAALSVHPVGAQGFNLALRGVAELAETLLACDADIGDAQVLQQYARARKRESFMVRHFTHGLLELFCDSRAPRLALSGGALHLVEMSPRLKRALLHRTLGLGARTRLARGLPPA